MLLRVGTSGFSYEEWKGPFYPADLPASRMLEHYAARLGAVEINNTFYRLPKASVLESWASQVPEHFRFSIKASRRITHLKRLRDVADETAYLMDTVRALGARLGVVLFQLPPNLKADQDRLAAFVERVPGDVRAAFEFRHPSWLADPATVRTLHGAGAVVCVAETDEGMEGEVPDPQADGMAGGLGGGGTGGGDGGGDGGGAAGPRFGYLRLRKAGYSEAELAAWADRVRRSGWGEAFLFFKHEEAGLGPALAARFSELACGREARGGG